MEFLYRIFDSDRKNYHAWSYRIWFVERFQLWESELEFIEEMLGHDPTNNSVWSYRFFILNKAPLGLFKGSAAPGSFDFVRSEVQQVINNYLSQQDGLSNESCWVYLRGMLCNSDEEEIKSQSTPSKRVNINKLRTFMLPFLESSV